jgi:hypothetical protein
MTIGEQELGDKEGVANVAADNERVRRHDYDPPFPDRLGPGQDGQPTPILVEQVGSDDLPRRGVHKVPVFGVTAVREVSGTHPLLRGLVPPRGNRD